MFNVTKCEFNIKGLYGDFRDWFIIDNPVHKTILQIYLCDQFIGESLFPINSKEINCEIEASVQQDCDLEYLTWCVPEMGIKRRKQFSSAQTAHIGDTITAEIEINMFGEE